MSDPTAASTQRLADLLRGRRTVVLSGAGISTESGIPDYRGVDRTGPPPTPVTYQQFVRDAHVRQRYWARSTLGWPAMRSREPNAGHRAVARLEHAGHVTGVITQNVDGLHEAAGSHDVVELHGTLATVVCLNCGAREDRGALQARLESLNPGFAGRTVTILPDGDAAIPDEWIEAFVVAACTVCGGVLKTDVVFFGENVPKERAVAASDMVASAAALLVVGSSLEARSGLRLVLAAVQDGKPIAVVNRGPTRADEVATLRIEARLGEVLPALADELSPVAAP
jgi:NAD-dependent SIR2 family protein deacetylase